MTERRMPMNTPKAEVSARGACAGDPRQADARRHARTSATRCSSTVCATTYMLGIAPLSPDQPQMVGPAFTLRFIPSREDLDSLANYSRSDNLHRRAHRGVPAGLRARDRHRRKRQRFLRRRPDGGSPEEARRRRRRHRGRLTATPAGIRKTGLPAYQYRTGAARDADRDAPGRAQLPDRMRRRCGLSGRLCAGRLPRAWWSFRAIWSTRCATTRLPQWSTRCSPKCRSRGAAPSSKSFPPPRKAAASTSAGGRGPSRAGEIDMNPSESMMKTLEVLIQTTDLDPAQWIDFRTTASGNSFLWKNLETGASDRAARIPERRPHSGEAFARLEPVHVLPRRRLRIHRHRAAPASRVVLP